MLATTVVINLAGIMLSSGRSQNLEEHIMYQLRLVTYMVLFAVVGCAILLVVALGRDIWLAKNIERNMTRGRWRTAIKKQIELNTVKRGRVKRYQDADYQAMKVAGMSNKSVVILRQKHRPPYNYN